MELDFWVGGHRLGSGWGCCCCCYSRPKAYSFWFGILRAQHIWRRESGNLRVRGSAKGNSFCGTSQLLGPRRRSTHAQLVGWMDVERRKDSASQRVCNVPGRRIWRSTQIQFARSPAKAQQNPNNRQLANLGSRAKHSSCRPGRNDSTRMAQDNRCILIICFGCNCLSCSAQWLYICGYSKNKKRPASSVQQKARSPQVHKSRSPTKRPHNSAKA